MGFSCEAHKILTGYAVPRLTHIMKSVPKDPASIEWMESVDEAHLSTWLSCSGAETLHAALSHPDRSHLAASLDPPPPPPQFGGVGLQTLIRIAEEELLGSWASITSDLISF
jgi:hypothetical protein